MFYPCPRCGKKAEPERQPDLDKDRGGLRRKRECTACGHKFRTQENEDSVVEKIALREFKREYAAQLDELRRLLSAFRGLLRVAKNRYQ